MVQVWFCPGLVEMNGMKADTTTRMSLAEGRTEVNFREPHSCF